MGDESAIRNRSRRGRGEVGRLRVAQGKQPSEIRCLVHKFCVFLPIDCQQVQALWLLKKHVPAYPKISSWKQVIFCCCLATTMPGEETEEARSELHGLPSLGRGTFALANPSVIKQGNGEGCK